MIWINSSARFPADIYERLKDRAYQERKSVNALVVEAVKRLLEEEK